MDKIDLYNRLTPPWFGILVIKFGAAAVLSLVGVLGLGRGDFDSGTWMALALGLVALGFALYDLTQLTNPKVQITLTPEGLLDHRMNKPLLLPWKYVASIFHVSVDGHTITVELSGMDAARFTGPGTARSPLSSTAVNIQLEHVDVDFYRFERLVHRVAPEVKFASLTRRPK